MIRIELHSHTTYSKDSLMTPRRLLEICEARGIDRIAITDHNEIDGALEAARLDPERVIISEEIMTSKGELLAYFIQRRVDPHQDPIETIQQLRNQGAVISVAHPFDAIRSGSWELDDLLMILPHIDAIEVFNGRTMSDSPNKQAEELAAEHGLLSTAGSDAHSYREVGRTHLILPPFSDPASFLQSLDRAEIVRHRSSPLIHFASRYATLVKSLGLRNP
jgi:predicted metal-dependent phosphoesterase TrpH